ncbi:MAG: hypothetical protein II811_10170, partial [Spirochaetaceae bacterium]|nr:hypothetical protein [Spirochaetaceae bacterium]
RPALIVFYQEKAELTENDVSYEIYKAWKLDALVKLNQMDSVNETIDFDLSFSDRKTGAVRITNGNVSFMAGSWNGGTFEKTEE